MFDLPIRAHAAAVPFTSAAVDGDLYRDGAVLRGTANYASRTLVCDEIRRLRRRFCSLEGAARAAAGNVIARVIVSTGDDGRRAGRSAPRATPRRLPIASCDASNCTTVWTLSKAEIGALGDGLSLPVRYGFVSSRPAWAAAIIAPVRLRMADGTIAARGFSQAVAASLR